MRILLTGASGFLGSHALRHILSNTNWEIVCPVTFSHKGVPERIVQQVDGLDNDFARTKIIKFDLSTPINKTTINKIGHIDYILNYASESHVDRSISEPLPFIRNNIDISLNLLEYARTVQPKKFIQISTDEVYGPAPLGYAHKEWDTYYPSNPYSASKACQESISFSYWRAYNVPIMIINCMNLIGEMQDAEKFVPKTINKILHREPMTIHASTSGVIGSRFYLHARNLADAALFMLKNIEPTMYNDHDNLPQKLHVVGEREINNLEMAKLISKYMNMELLYDLVDFHSSRPGHDLRYALDGSKAEQLGWKRPVELDSSLEKLIEWTLRHPMWLK